MRSPTHRALLKLADQPVGGVGLGQQPHVLAAGVHDRQALRTNDQVDVLSSKLRSPARRRGRPLGGGKKPKQAREALLDAAARSLIEHGYRASTMEVIAAEAGYTRSVLYHHFATRKHLFEAVLQRSTLRVASKIVEHQAQSATLGHLIAEGFVIVATELPHDPLYTIVAEQTEPGNLAHLVANATDLMEFIESKLDQMLEEETEFLREGVRTIDAAKFLVASALGFQLGLVAGSEDPDQVRRYVTTFILPAIMADPPRPCLVFK